MTDYGKQHRTDGERKWADVKVVLVGREYTY